jgi:hypothetical protein
MGQIKLGRQESRVQLVPRPAARRLFGSESMMRLRIRMGPLPATDGALRVATRPVSKI